MKHIKLFEQFIEEAILLPGQQKIKRADALDVAKIIIEGLGFEYVNPDTVTTSYSFVPKVGIPVGSIRRKRSEVGDIDIIKLLISCEISLSYFWKAGLNFVLISDTDFGELNTCKLKYPTKFPDVVSIL